MMDDSRVMSSRTNGRAEIIALETDSDHNMSKTGIRSRKHGTKGTAQKLETNRTRYRDNSIKIY